MNKRKLYPLLMIFGASILLFRTIRLLTIENGYETLAIWVIIFTFIEMLIDLFCIFYSIIWLIKNSTVSKKISLRFGASAAIFHSFRVLIYVIGRVGPFNNFDLKPQFQENTEFNIFWVYFASVLSILGIIGTIIIWLKIKKVKNKK